MKRFLSTVASVVVLGSMSLSGAGFDVEKVYELECQGCHGPMHQGGVGSDIRPEKLKDKTSMFLADTILEGRSGTAMPPFKGSISKQEASQMVDYLQKFAGKKIDVLTLDNVKSKWRTFNKASDFAKKYPDPTDVKSIMDVVFVTERDASKVTFIDGTSGKILSRHPAGFAVHVTVTNKRMPRYAYSISRDGLVTMFDLNTPGQQKIAEVRVGSESRGLGVSPDGKYLLAGNYTPGGAVMLDAMTLEPLKVYPTSSVIDMDGNIGESRVASIADTPYGPYFAMALKDAGHVYIIDYSKPDFPIVGDIPGIGKILHDAFLNEGKEMGRYYMIASQGSDVIGIVDFKTKSLVSKVYTGAGSKPHPGQGSSWLNEKYGQLHATVNMNVGSVSIWDNNWDIVRHIPTGGGGLFIGTSEHTPYIWADNVLGSPAVWNEVHLIDKQHLETAKIIKVGTTEGQLIDGKTKKVLKTWKVPTVKDKDGKAVVPRILHAEPANHGQWTMISEWNAGRIGIYDAQTGEFVKYIEGLITPTFTYSVEHRQTIPGA